MGSVGLHVGSSLTIYMPHKLMYIEVAANNMELSDLNVNQ